MEGQASMKQAMLMKQVSLISLILVVGNILGEAEKELKMDLIESG